MADEVKKEDPKKKGVLGKIKDKILPIRRSKPQLYLLLLDLAFLCGRRDTDPYYVAIPGVPQQKIDPTFIASSFYW